MCRYKNVKFVFISPEELKIPDWVSNFLDEAIKNPFYNRQAVTSATQEKSVSNVPSDTACSSGGNLSDGIGQQKDSSVNPATTDILQPHVPASTIRDKIEVDAQIQTAISGKKMESAVMAVMPFGILGYMKLSSPEFIDILYHNVIGVIFMSVCLVIIGCMNVVARRIVNIEI